MFKDNDVSMKAVYDMNMTVVESGKIRACVLFFNR